MEKGFFVTGTDTGVGKTVVAAAVARVLKSAGIRTAVMKPVETGCRREGDVLVPSDGLFLKSVAGMDENVSVVTPSVFECPLAPLAASEIEGRDVVLDDIFRAYGILKGRYDAVVMEGIGGLHVPVKKDYFVADLALDTGLPLIIVARPSLGTINHTLLTIHYARARGLRMAGIIINYSDEPEGDLAEETSERTIREVTDVPIIGIFPHLRYIDEETLYSMAARCLDMDRLLKLLT